MYLTFEQRISNFHHHRQLDRNGMMHWPFPNQNMLLLRRLFSTLPTHQRFPSNDDSLSRLFRRQPQPFVESDQITITRRVEKIKNKSVTRDDLDIAARHRLICSLNLSCSSVSFYYYYYYFLSVRKKSIPNSPAISFLFSLPLLPVERAPPFLGSAGACSVHLAACIDARRKKNSTRISACRTVFFSQTSISHTIPGK